MPKIQIIVGSTRDARMGRKVADWVYRDALNFKSMSVELVDLKDYPLPFFNEGISPAYNEGKYETPGAKEWAEKVGEADGYIIVANEYNHGYSAVLKNALDYVYKEWNNKPVAFVSYGGIAGGTRAVQQLRQVVIELQMVPIREGAHIPFVWQALDENGEPKDNSLNDRLQAVFTQLSWWANILKKAREESK